MKNPNNAIEVSNVKKYFKVYYDRGITIKDRFLSHGRNKYEKREVLKGITFEVKKGEAIGLIGKNGCGKSTTLKLLTKIIYPNEGTLELSGRVSSLLELGAGFHPDMSGKENIYMNAAVFGLSRKEIDKRVDDIIEFSELSEYIDNPVRTYSSGMYMRLAFSVAINVDADILLIDEILAVGDVSFQKKCFDKLKDIKRSGTTIVIVSHSLDQIEKICDRSIWIEDGLIKMNGATKQVHDHYLQRMEENRLAQIENSFFNQINESADKNSPESENTSSLKPVVETVSTFANRYEKNLLAVNDPSRIRRGNRLVEFTAAYMTDWENNETIIHRTGSGFKLYLEYVSKQQGLQGNFCFLIYRDDGVYCYGTNTYIEYKEIMTIKQSGNIQIEVPQNLLLPGKYYVQIAIYDPDIIYYDDIQYLTAFHVLASKEEQGVFSLENHWIIN